MDTPIKLWGINRQIDFDGEARIDRLKLLIVFLYDLVSRVVRRILGDEYIFNDYRFRDNPYMLAMFISISLHFKKDREFVE